ncbi:hypothetical protein GCM10028796_13350 [Ramlibacter monticola]|uniref:Fibronectin type-III domain-containing protein n=1 Tax=Ramlibacter monticola TaxID=1926872 RepID=A0A936YWC0_9BURK|nr:hypothetical protein [Ramlibacter monticola]MBL0390178.1 hypothetical protein [Ramlibacter monticola]
MLFALRALALLALHLPLAGCADVFFSLLEATSISSVSEKRVQLLPTSRGSGASGEVVIRYKDNKRDSAAQIQVHGLEPGAAYVLEMSDRPWCTSEEQAADPHEKLRSPPERALREAERAFREVSSVWQTDKDGAFSGKVPLSSAPENLWSTTIAVVRSVKVTPGDRTHRTACGKVEIKVLRKGSHWHT